MPEFHRDFVRRILRAIGRHELLVLVVWGVVALGIWGFAELADEVVEGEMRDFDHTVLLALRTPHDASDPIGPHWMEEVVRDFSAMGGVGVLTFISLAAAGFLLLERKARAALLLGGAVVGGWLLIAMLKIGFDRPRPDLVPHGSYVVTASFPSGHAMMAAVTYLTLGALLARVHHGRTLKAYLLLLALLLTLLVGFSRVYLGVHWPTDVAAGWVAGGAWAALWWLIARRLQQRGRVEEDEPANTE